jgi:hypothetical protein
MRLGIAASVVSLAMVFAACGATNYSLPAQTTSGGAWVISLGLPCVGGFAASTTEFTITDNDGHSASTYISTQ